MPETIIYTCQRCGNSRRKFNLRENDKLVASFKAMCYLCRSTQNFVLTKRIINFKKNDKKNIFGICEACNIQFDINEEHVCV